MNLCTRCHKRLAVVYIQRIDGNETKSEGICLKCAKELGIKPINDMMSKMGIDEEDLDRLDDEMEGLIESGEIPMTEDDSEGRAPAVDFSKIFGGLGSRENSEKEQKSEGKKVKESKKKFLSEYCEDLTLKAREGRMDSIVGRERELGRLIQILCRRQKNNPCLIGEPGVGKTAIAEALAQKIASGNVPYKLKDKEVHLVDLTSLVAGTQFRGQFEQRIKGLINEVTRLGNIILVIDEVHSIVGAGDAEGSMNAANILKPALSRGQIQLIGATTLSEYRKYIEKDSALERRFQPVIVEEPSIEDSIKMLTGIKGYYESFHGVKIPAEIVRRAVILSERYITDRFLPDKAIDLLDESSAYLALSSPVIEQLNETVDRLAAVKSERETLENEETEEIALEQKYKRLADLKAEEARLSESFETLSRDKEHVVLTDEDLARVIEVWTGIPSSSITESEFKKISELSDRLKQRIVGQDEAIDSLCRAIKRSRAGVSYQKRPVSFIFAGSTGVGKTALVKALANELFDSPETLIRLDMTEFMEKHSVSRIIGAPPGYVGYDDAGQLTEKIRRKPYSVVLFDEIEKAHPDVMNILLQILDDGRITDAQGRHVNFENTVIVMTTNAGSDLNTNSAGFSDVKGFNTKDKTMKALSDFLRPEFLNRVDEIITFNPLTRDDFLGIAKIMMRDLSAVLSEKGIQITYSDEVCRYIADQSYSEKFGARNMRRYIQTHIEDAVADKIICAQSGAVSLISVDLINGDLVFTTNNE